MEEISTHAFVLRTRAYGESDSIVSLLTEDAGKVGGIAKGARRSKRRFAGGALEPFRELAVRMTRKPNAGLALLAESRIVAANLHVAEDLSAFAWASYLSELTDAMTPERDPCPELFRLYRDAISEFGSSPAEPLAHHFVLGLLDGGGWAPDFGTCGVCAEEVSEYSRPILDHRGSGIICSVHEAETQGVSPDDPGFRPSRRVIEPELLAYVNRARERVEAPPDARICELATALLDRLVDLQLGRSLKSRGFIAHLRAAAAEAAAAAAGTADDN